MTESENPTSYLGVHNLKIEPRLVVAGVGGRVEPAVELAGELLDVFVEGLGNGGG